MVVQLCLDVLFLVPWDSENFFRLRKSVLLVLIISAVNFRVSVSEVNFDLDTGT